MACLSFLVFGESVAYHRPEHIDGKHFWDLDIGKWNGTYKVHLPYIVGRPVMVDFIRSCDCPHALAYYKGEYQQEALALAERGIVPVMVGVTVPGEGTNVCTGKIKIPGGIDNLWFGATLFEVAQEYQQGYTYFTFRIILDAEGKTCYHGYAGWHKTLAGGRIEYSWEVVANRVLASATPAFVKSDFPDACSKAFEYIFHVRAGEAAQLLNALKTKLNPDDKARAEAILAKLDAFRADRLKEMDAALAGKDIYRFMRLSEMYSDVYSVDSKALAEL